MIGLNCFVEDGNQVIGQERLSDKRDCQLDCKKVNMKGNIFLLYKFEI